MNYYRVRKSTLSGRVTAPPSKSHTLRSILFATLADGDSVIDNYLHSPDTLAMISACRQLGATIKVSDERLDISGVSGKPQLPDDVIDAGNSGQVLRFITAVAALVPGHVVVTGDHSIRYNRPVKPLLDGLRGLGANCTSLKGDNHAPIILHGPIKPGVTILDGQDSQPVSGLLIAAAFLPGETEIYVSNPGEQPWIALTLDWFDRLGIKYKQDGYQKYLVYGNSHIQGFEYTVPGDFSSIAYPLVAAIISQSEIEIYNVDMSDPQGDKLLVDILISMGANITIDLRRQRLLIKPGSYLQGKKININRCIDAITILAVVGCYAEGTTTLTHGAIARKKECDRIACITAELKKMGANIEETADGVKVTKSHLTGAMTQSYNDHRMVMSLAIAGLGANDETCIENVDCVAKSYPNFIQHMKQLGCTMELVQ